MVFCTISAANHLPKAAALAKSLKQTQASHELVLCLVERDVSSAQNVKDCFDEIVLASDIGISDFDRFVFRYTVTEACSAIKAQFLLWAMKAFPEEQAFIFLDPDVFAYSRFEELELLQAKASILLTPHVLYDEQCVDRIRDNIFRVLVAGTFNMGFFALRRCPIAFEFLEWWNRKLQAFCYMDWTRGFFADQKWVLLATSFFDVQVLREPGYNVANWNVYERRLTLSQSDGYLVRGKPLRFFHFSGIDTGRDLYYCRKQLNENHPVFDMRDKYLDEVRGFDAGGQSGKAWSYDYFFSGERVHEARLAFRNNPKLAQVFPEPFMASGAAIFSSLASPNRARST